MVYIYIRWNLIATLFLHCDKSISGLAAAMLDLQLKTTSGDVAYITVESGTSENMGIAIEISLIATPEPAISWG